MRAVIEALSTIVRRRPPVAVGQTPSDVIFRENKWSLLRYRPRPEGLRYKTPVLLVPSLINRHYVLDLMPGKSFAEYLVSQGHDVHVIDWGTPGPEDRYLSFDDIADRYLGRALRKASGPGGKAHVLGYCLGGTLAAIHGAAHPSRFASFVALAAPVDFDDDGIIATWTRQPGFDVEALVSACGNVPWELMQAAFQLIRPTMGLAKAVGVIDKLWNDEYLDGFFALETWGNDNVSFPGEAYREYIEKLYRANALVKGQLTLSGAPVALSRLVCPTLAITFEQDNIVPQKSASALLELIGSKDKERIHLPGGHVGAVVSRSAAKGLWPKISAYWAERDEPPGKKRAVRSEARA